MQILRSYPTRLDADLARIALDAEGVPSIVVGTGTELEGGVAGVHLLVPEEWVAAARAALEASDPSEKAT
jgi:hypothetical protein